MAIPIDTKRVPASFYSRVPNFTISVDHIDFGQELNVEKNVIRLAEDIDRAERFIAKLREAIPPGYFDLGEEPLLVVKAEIGRILGEYK